MADSKITALTSIGASTDPASDPLVLVDVSDTSMAATGTTKKVTLNQLLGASGTATLASATITGAATVGSDLSLNGNENYVYLFSNYSIGNNSRVRFRAVGAGGGSGYGGDFRVSTRASNNTWNTDVLTIDSSANCIWTDGAGGTRMTLNSTGLGVGGSPATKIFANVTPPGAGQDGVRVSDGTRLIQMSISGSTYSYQGIGANQNVIYASGNPLSILSDAQNLRLGTSSTSYLLLDTSGNVGISVQPSAWNSNYNALDIGQNGTISGRVGSSNTVDLASNGFRNTSGNWVYKLATSNTACRYQLDGSTGSHIWYSGAAGTAGNTIAGFSSALMTLDASGNLILQPPSSPPTLGTNGQLTVNATSNTNLRFSYRGSDGVTRVANITLA